MKEVCGNCIWFLIEPDIKIPYGTSETVSGKCFAEFAGKDNRLGRYDMIVNSIFTCDATDDNGSFLFSPNTNRSQEDVLDGLL